MHSWPTVYIPRLPERLKLPTLSLYDSASRSIQLLPKQDVYRLYVCGITPYDATHLGHAATYLAFDILHRYLIATGSIVKFVQNITDIDDPLLERAERDGVSWEELALSQIELFRGDMVDLHIVPPLHYVGVVEAMPIVIEAVSQLQKKGSTYLVDGDMYFRVHDDPEYGQRAHLSERDSRSLFAERGGDPDRPGKENPFDALIWLTSKPDQPTWPSPFGSGRPGWHIECSAIAQSFLDPDPNAEFSIDVQGGGSDLLFPHHEMSAAQSRVLTGKRFARFYLHAGMIGLDGVKMSKSLGNLVFVSRLVNSGVNPMAIRWALLNRPYRDDFMWTSRHLDNAVGDIERLQRNLSKVDVSETDSVIAEIALSISRNLDTESAISALIRWCEATEKGETGGNAGELSRAIDALLGIAL